MTSLDIIALIVTILAVASFSVVFTLLFGTYAKSVIQGYKDGKNDAELNRIRKGQAKRKSRKKKTARSRKTGNKFCSYGVRMRFFHTRSGQ